MSELIEKMESTLSIFAEELQKLKASLAAKYSDALKNEMERLNLPYVYVTGYTPYFNDGDECKFSAHVDDPVDNGHFDDELTTVFGDGIPEYDYDMWANIDAQIYESSEIFKDAYGDHAMHLFVLKDGVFHEFHQEYDHD